MLRLILTKLYIITYKERPVEKLLYTIGKVSNEIGEKTSLVRFWADKFPAFIKPSRNKKGNRLFTSQDLNNFRTIHYLVKECGLTLEGAAKKMKDNKEGLDNRVEVISKLNYIKEQLQEVAANL